MLNEKKKASKQTTEKYKVREKENTEGNKKIQIEKESIVNRRVSKSVLRNLYALLYEVVAWYLFLLN